MDGISGENILIVYYSRTGTARTVAEKLGERLGCAVEYVTYAKGKPSPSFLRVLYEAVTRRSCEIKGDSGGYSKYGRVIVVSPVWASGLATPMRSFMKKHAAEIGSYAFISVSQGNSLAEEDATASAGKPPDKSAMLLSETVKNGEVDFDSLATLAEIEPPVAQGEAE